MARISAPEMSVSSGTRPSPGKNQTMIQGTLTSMPTEPNTDSSNRSPSMPNATKPTAVPAPENGGETVPLRPAECRTRQERVESTEVVYDGARYRGSSNLTGHGGRGALT
jgi:hypothetical protein